MNVNRRNFTSVCVSQFRMLWNIHTVPILHLLDSKKEKAVRSSLKSDIQRKLDSNDLLIFDGSNYIKGYRYEIYCTTKLYKTPQCTLYCNLPIEQAWLWNSKRPESDQYDGEIFDSLVSRWLHYDNNIMEIIIRKSTISGVIFRCWKQQIWSTREYKSMGLSTFHSYAGGWSNVWWNLLLSLQRQITETKPEYPEC